MKRIPMMMQLALILFCIMAIPMAILTWYSSSQILQNSEHAFAETSLAELNANRELNENALNNLSQNTVRLEAPTSSIESVLISLLQSLRRIT